MAVSEAGPARPPIIRRRRLEPDARREQILSVAIRLFGDRPYADVSTTDVARGAGVARGLVNHYFGTKKELYLEVIRVMLTVPEVALSRLPDGGPAERADAIVTWFLDVVSRHSTSWLAAITAGGMAGDPDVDEVIAEAVDIAADSILSAVGPAPTASSATAAATGPAGPSTVVVPPAVPAAGPAGPSSGITAGAPPAASASGSPPAAEPGEALRGMARAYVGLATYTAREWLQRDALTRDQVHTLLTTTLLTMVEKVFPRAT
ncbi:MULTISPECIES: TetR/AcrR family transcriptional regulator [unclassified Actinoplanes]|uniref:TetR/AcrR family transcriptional regulator n=1 Tax=unclassified Actinoplanes TaxID=2626549 RepID=UPI0002F20C40|nr:MULTISPECIES: TetR/AcrR family transcriptional regulator [unclassified Actinoplanes]